MNLFQWLKLVPIFSVVAIVLIVEWNYVLESALVIVSGMMLGDTVNKVRKNKRYLKEETE